jgi:hypothetical protein
MRPSLSAVAALNAILCCSMVAQSSGNWSAPANTSTSSLHSGVAGGKHEFVDVTNNVNTGGGGSAPATLTIVHFVPNPNGSGVTEETFTVTIPAGQHRSFYGDVKSVVVTAGNIEGKGSYTITIP